jgi:hypothetical protein
VFGNNPNKSIFHSGRNEEQTDVRKCLLSFCAESFVLSLLSIYMHIKIYRTMILPVVSYGRETWSLTLREERRLRVPHNRVLRKTFGSKRDKVMKESRRLHNEELYDLLASLNVIWMIKLRMRWAEHIARMGKSRGAHKVLVRRTEVNIPLERPRHRWEGNIYTDLQEVEGGQGMD